jgi:hypothetical protein
VKGRTPNMREKAWMDKISHLGCIVCLKYEDVYTPSEVHHIQGKTKPGAHLLTLPLCFNHHREGSMNGLWVSRHPWKTEFEKRYGKEEELLKEVQKNMNNRKSESEKLQDELEPIVHPTEYDESDDLEYAKRVELDGT